MALAAAQQGRYAPIHDAMFRLGQPIATGAFDGQLQANAQLAAQLGISGTPGWVVGDQTLNGAVGLRRLGEAIEEARRS